MSDQRKVEVYTLAELREKAQKERRERLHNGVQDGSFRVYFQKSSLTLQIERDNKPCYEIDLERCNNSSELLDWILHIHNKDWGHPGGLLAAVLTTLDDACNDVFDEDTQTLFMNGKKTLNWKNPL